MGSKTWADYFRKIPVEYGTPIDSSLQDSYAPPVSYPDESSGASVEGSTWVEKLFSANNLRELMDLQTSLAPMAGPMGLASQALSKAMSMGTPSTRTAPVLMSTLAKKGIKYAPDILKEAQEGPPSLAKYDPNEMVTLYRGTFNPYLGAGGLTDIKTTRFTNSLQTARNNAGDQRGTIYKINVRKGDLIPAQELFDPKFAQSPELVKTWEEIARLKYGGDKIAASLNAPGEPQVLFGGKTNVSRLTPTEMAKLFLKPFTK